MTSSTSRYDAVSRRAFVKRSLALGALVAVPGLACSSDDKKTFENPSTASTGATGAVSSTTTAGVATPSSAAGSSSTTGTGAPDATASTAVAGASTPVDTVAVDTVGAAGGTFPTGGQLAVAFTYAASGGGRVNNPYIAVWVEDSNGELIKTISVWYKQRDSKYLNELQRWASAEGALQSSGGSDPYDTVSGATRVPGSYTVAWDGTDLAGAPVPLGDYFVCVEAAREHGPYELVRGAITIGTSATTFALTPNGELTAASAELTV